MKEHSMRINFRNNRRAQARKIREFQREEIAKDNIKSKLTIKEGPRMIFLRAFALNGNIEEAKQALMNNGFKLDSFENPKTGKTADDTFNEWIEEFQNKNNLSVEEIINKGR